MASTATQRAGTPPRAGTVTLRSALTLTGFTALVVQVLLLRELMVAWRGNEMSFGVTLSVWLGLTGLGGIAFGALRKGREVTRLTLARWLLGVGGLAPVALLTARLARRAMGLHPGEIVGIGPLAGAAFASLAPFTLAAGFLFAVAVSVVARDRGARSGAIAEVYVLEAVGAVLGGVAMSFLLLPVWDPVRIACLTTALDALGALVLAMSASEVGPGAAGGVRRGLARPAFRGSRTFACAAALVLCSGVMLAGPAGHALDDWTVRLQWRELGVTSQKNSIYGRIITAQAGTQMSVYESGVLVASAPDRLAAEEAVHIPMLEHPSPARVLLLGGGLGGTVLEILKHPTVEAVDYVELDPELPQVARRAFGARIAEGLDDPRVEVHFADARFYVKRTTRRYDVVVVNVPDPTTALLNRFYTVEFLREARSILRPGGVVGLTLSSAENYVSAELADVLASVKRSVTESFPNVTVIPGNPTHFIAGGTEGYVTRDPAVLSERIADRDLDVVYVRDYYLFDRLSEGRVNAADESIRRSDAPRNTDLLPAGYYLSLVVWNRELAGPSRFFSSARRHLTPGGAALVAALVAALLAGPALSARRARGAFRRNVLAAIFIVGATEISLEIAALTAFQSLYGYVYHRMAIIVAAFMAGLAAGGVLGARVAHAGAGERAFAALQGGIAVVPLLLGAAIVGIAGLPPERLELWATWFPLIVVGSAVLAGMQFPLAGKLYLGEGSEVGAIGGRLYGADLLGSAIGATAAAVLVLPIMGIPGAMLALFGLNVAVLVCLVVPLVVLRQASRSR
jgi:spermidine synthase